MTSTTPPAFVEHKPSKDPGGFKPSPDLDRANVFGRIHFALKDAEAALTGAVVAQARKAADAFGTDFQSDAFALQALAQNVEDGTRQVRDLMQLMNDRLNHYRQAESSTLTFAPKHLDALQIAAGELAAKNRAEEMRYSRGMR